MSTVPNSAARGTLPPTLPPLCAIDADVQRLKDALRRCRRHAKGKTRCRTTRNLLARIDKDRATPHRHMLLVSRDGFERGAPRADVEGPWREGLGAIDGWYQEATNGVLRPMGASDVLRLSEDEQAAEGVTNVAQLRLHSDQSAPALDAALTAAVEQRGRLDRFIDGIRALYFATTRTERSA